jgi:hypothetical protein
MNIAESAVLSVFIASIAFVCWVVHSAEPLFPATFSFNVRIVKRGPISERI